VFDLSVGSLFLGADPSAAATPVLSERIFRELRAAGVPVGVGRYDEARLIYATPAFASGARLIDERYLSAPPDLRVLQALPAVAPSNAPCSAIACAVETVPACGSTAIRISLQSATPSSICRPPQPPYKQEIRHRHHGFADPKRPW
jgi:hypothetical protein